jgi:hydrogenase maturation factor
MRKTKVWMVIHTSTVMRTIDDERMDTNCYLWSKFLQLEKENIP